MGGRVMIPEGVGEVMATSGEVMAVVPLASWERIVRLAVDVSTSEGAAGLAEELARIVVAEESERGR